MEYSAFEEATVPICSFVLKNGKETAKGLYFKLSEFKGGMEVQREKVIEALKDNSCAYFYETSATNFSKIPGSPIAYWVSDNFIQAFRNKTMGEVAKPRQGMATSDNNKFLRLWYEISENKMCLNAADEIVAEQSGKKWFPYNKGGEYRKWYGNNDFLINWEYNGQEVKALATKLYKTVTRTIKNMQFYFQPCISWSLISSGKVAFRYKQPGNLFDVAGMSCFSDDNLYYLLALCDSKITDAFLAVFSPTINFQAGDIANIPVAIVDDQVAPVENVVKENIELSKSDWDAYETSWDFKRHPLV